MNQTYVCTELVDGICQTWAVQSSILPPISVADGLRLGWLVVACYVTAWGLGLLTRFLLSHERN